MHAHNLLIMGRAFFSLAMSLAGILNFLMPMTVAAIDHRCDLEQNLVMGQEYYIYSIDYPRPYEPGVICKWVGKSQIGTKIILTCEDIDLPSTPNCRGDKLSISLSGSENFSDAKNYCGRGSLTLVSSANKIVVGLFSDGFSGSGKFMCTMTAVLDDEGTTTTEVPKVCDCGWKHVMRIVGGNETGINEFPCMAGVVDIRGGQGVFCGGVIISNRYVLTTGHCIYRKSYDTLAVLVGDHNISTGSDTPASALYLVDAYEIHPQYDPDTQLNDIAILRTAKTIVFGIFVGPVCLPFRFTSYNFYGQDITALGWGNLGFSEPKPDVLQKVNLQVITNQECSEAYKKEVAGKQLCTYGPGKDTCQGDSGGPLLWMDTSKARLHLVGLISYGLSCGSKIPGVNTRVTSYIPWIVGRTSDANYCIK